MLQGLLSVFYAFSCIFLILIILVQKGKSSMGLGQMGGQSQMLFGSSGGQDIFQKITWVLGVILIFGSLGIAILRSRESKHFAVSHQEQTMPAQLPAEE